MFGQAVTRKDKVCKACSSPEPPSSTGTRSVHGEFRCADAVNTHTLTPFRCADAVNTHTLTPFMCADAVNTHTLTPFMCADYSLCVCVLTHTHTHRWSLTHPHTHVYYRSSSSYTPTHSCVLQEQFIVHTHTLMCITGAVHRIHPHTHVYYRSSSPTHRRSLMCVCVHTHSYSPHSSLSTQGNAHRCTHHYKNIKELAQSRLTQGTHTQMHTHRCISHYKNIKEHPFIPNH